jgi:acetyltransferase-like isoleucine patch superfamily enzyme
MNIYRIAGLRKLWLIIENLVFNFFYSSELGNKVSIYGYPVLSQAPNSKIEFGKNITLISESYFSEPGVNHPVVIRLLNENARLKIGDNVGISGGGICVATEVSIGNNVMLGANTFITDTDFHPIAPENRRFSRENVKTRKVIIEENVFIGMDSIILKGVRIGKNSIVGAGSIVAKDIPENQIWGGNPAKFIREL